MSSIKLSAHQKDAVSKIAEWYHHPVRLDKKTFILNGYAGTGKTTLVKLLPELVLDADQGAVIYAAPTGKAALQLRKKGCEKTTTLHKLLYSPLEKNRTRLLEITAALRVELQLHPAGDSTLAASLKAQLRAERKAVSTPGWQVKKPDLCGIKLIVTDEASMVDAAVYNDLLALDVPLVFIGDPFQLPPVFGTSPVMSQEPDFVLNEVHRQSLDSPILVAATELRGGKYPSIQKGQDQFQVIPVKDATYSMYEAADQVLCGRNKTRHALNAKMRCRLVESGKIARSELPAAVGDRVVFLKNDHEEGIFNGTIGTLSAVEALASDPESLSLDFTDDTGNAVFGYEAWGGVLEGREAHEAPRRAQLVDYSYGMTVHKAQGQEWPSVLVHSEPVGHGTDALRWLYTAITRAQNKCILVTREN